MVNGKDKGEIHRVLCQGAILTFTQND